MEGRKIIFRLDPPLIPPIVRNIRGDNMDSEKSDKEGKYSLFTKLIGIGIASITLTGTVTGLFAPEIDIKCKIIAILSLYVLGLFGYAYYLFEKNIAHIEKENHLIENNKALGEQFRKKSYLIDMIRTDIPLIWVIVYDAIRNQDESARIECFKNIKEALKKWEIEISKW